MVPTTAQYSGANAKAIVLPVWGFRPLTLQFALLLAAAVLLPSAAHLLGLSVRMFLPMHWPVLLVGLVYGWRSGLIIGLAAPSLSFLVSGMPRVGILPAMSAELATYGLLAGFFREVLKLNVFLATGLALLVGRMIFIVVASATGAYTTSLAEYLRVAVAPGAWAGIAQLLVLPVIAYLWVRAEQRGRESR